MSSIADIPNTLIERMFYRSYTDYEDIRMYRSLIERANQAKTQDEQNHFIGSATAFASTRVERRLYELTASLTLPTPPAREASLRRELRATYP